LVKIDKRPGVYGEYHVVVAPCVTCGNKAEGKVANSRKNEEASGKIAREWAEQLRTGQAALKCKACYEREREAQLEIQRRRIG